eukprot:m.279746 g.279746  ORF g.279746 m.279746 type:complete len:254 (+) comp143515_c0_seq1:74-835(+)
MEGTLEDYQTQFHTGKLIGGEVMRMLGDCGGLRVLDLGCGDGLLTEQIKQNSANVKVVGMDADPVFIAAAKAKGLDAVVGDGHTLAGFGDGSFDRVFSNAALHWMSRDPAAVIASVYRTLAPGGRFVSESGGGSNVAAIIAALSTELTNHGFDPVARNPWYFPDATTYAGLLTQAGFTVERCELVERPTTLPCAMSGWLKTFSGVWLRGIDVDTQQSILKNTSKALEATQLDARTGVWTADYVRLRVEATKPL